MEENPEASPYLQLARHVSHLSRTIQRRIDPPLREHLHLKGRELFVLRAVETGESNPMRIAERLDIAPSSASRTLDRLVELGLIDRADDPDDRRKTRLALTALGRRTAHQARRRVVEALQAAYHGVPRADIEHAVRVLARLAAHAESGEGAPDAGPDAGPGAGPRAEIATGPGRHG